MTRTIITISPDLKQWLDSYSRRQRLSSAEIIRRAIKEYRRNVSQAGLQRVLKETAGKWRPVKGDSQDHVDALRTEWEDRS
jgi:predicted transcriptional regulator